MMRFIAVGAALALLLAAGAEAAGTDLAEAEKLYVEECSKCHGTFTVQTAAWPATERRPGGLVKVAHRSGGPARGPLLAFAFPYGPSLQGVYGRAAGAVASFEYSKAFRKAQQGVVWDRENLDVYLTDTQAWAPGIIMFYRQPDPAVRTKIIDYLKAGG